jgi:hypothetical protein
MNGRVSELLPLLLLTSLRLFGLGEQAQRRERYLRQQLGDSPIQRLTKDYQITPIFAPAKSFVP